MPKYDDRTSLGGSYRGFPTTEWTKILDPLQRDAVLAELYQKYWKPLYTYLRCKGFPNDKAKDSVQGFFTDKVLGQELLQRADRTKGKFRNFLLVALRNYTINIEKADKQHQELDDETIQPIEMGSPEAEFDRVWAEELLQEVMRGLETECNRRGKTTHWQVFREWLIEPDAEGDNMQMGRICAKYGITNPSQAYNMISNIKKRFRAILRDRLRSMVTSDEEVNAEIAYFIGIFSRATTRL